MNLTVIVKLQIVTKVGWQVNNYIRKMQSMQNRKLKKMKNHNTEQKGLGSIRQTIWKMILCTKDRNTRVKLCKLSLFDTPSANAKEALCVLYWVISELPSFESGSWTFWLRDHSTVRFGTASPTPLHLSLCAQSTADNYAAMQSLNHIIKSDDDTTMVGHISNSVYIHSENTPTYSHWNLCTLLF